MISNTGVYWSTGITLSYWAERDAWSGEILFHWPYRQDVAT